MGLGSILVGIAVFVIVVAYVAWPFRRTERDWDRAIENWVENLTPAASESSSIALGTEPTPAPQPQPAPSPAEPYNFCPQCGRRIEPDHRFCPGCGSPLPGREASQ